MIHNKSYLDSKMRFLFSKLKMLSPMMGHVLYFDLLPFTTIMPYRHNFKTVENMTTHLIVFANDEHFAYYV